MFVVIFVLILILLILVHEFGHFIAAKAFGIKVEEFGIGFPPRIAGVKRGETLYSINALPLGGFVKIFGEEGQGMDNKRSYAARPAWQRATVLLAGVFFNALFAFFLFWIGFTIGFPSAVDDTSTSLTIRDQHIQILEVAKQSPASQSDIRRGDVIQSVSVNGENPLAVKTVKDLQTFTIIHKGQIVQLRVERGKELLIKEVISRANPPQGQGPLGIALAQVGLVSFPWYEAAQKAFIATYRNALYVVLGLWMLGKSLFGEGTLIGQVSGPVGIASMTGEFYNLGIHYLLSFIALISINLAVLNVLPIPALDGGRLFFILIEKLKGSPLRQELENKANAIGFALLVVLILIVTVKDILQL